MENIYISDQSPRNEVQGKYVKRPTGTKEKEEEERKTVQASETNGKDNPAVSNGLHG